MTDRILHILDAVDELHAGHVSTHYEECWKRHAGCLARLIRDVYEDHLIRGSD